MVPAEFHVQYFFSNPVSGIQTIARDQLIEDVPKHHPLVKSQIFVYNGDIIVDGQPQK